ncbi:hypothetical protein YC2023_034507 [Brassica napus]
MSFLIVFTMASDINLYQDGIVTPNAIYGDPLGALIHQTIYRDTPAPFRCLYCGITGLTTIRHTYIKFARNHHLCASAIRHLTAYGTRTFVEILEFA